MPHRVHWKRTYVAMAILVASVVISGVLAAMGWELTAVVVGFVLFIVGVPMLKHHQRRYRKTKPYDDET